MDYKKHVLKATSKEKASLVLKNGRIINVFNHSIEENDIAIEDGRIVGIGAYEGETEIDLKNQFVSPGFIDGHVHIESSMLTPSEFSKIIIPRGTTRVIADPHEIANVGGIEGIKYMINSSSRTPLDVHIMIPSCVPATAFETGGSELTAKDIKKIKELDGILGLGEMMNYPGVINGEQSVIDKLLEMKGYPLDGHAPDVYGKDLNAYLLTGIKTDHECTTKEELEEKVKRGMYIHLREGSATRNVKALSKAVTKENSHRLLFCTDDKHPMDIVEEGHINYNINLAVKYGVDPITAIQMATINIATCYQLNQVGAIAPGYVADLVVFKDLFAIEPSLVFKDGEIVAKDGEIQFSTDKYLNGYVTETIKLKPKKINIDLPLKSNKVRVIKLIENNVTTKKVIREVGTQDGAYVNNPQDDILKITVVERHHYTGNIGVGLLEGYGLKNGAVAMTIAHDSHNLICVGDNDQDMHVAINHLHDIQGGIVLVSKGEIIDSLQLEIGGIMTNQEIDIVLEKLKNMDIKSRELGVNKKVDDPFLSLAFMSLPVIPDIKITDLGLFDVVQFKRIEIEEE